jgi:putative transposase
MEFVRVAREDFVWPPPTAGTLCRWRRTGWIATSRRLVQTRPGPATSTYIATDDGWLFLAVVIDLFSRRVLGWSLQPHMQRSLVIDALEMAWQQRRPPQGELLFHSDRGSQYASEDFTRLLDEHGITASMSRKGNCWDNACSETLFGSLKDEWLHGRHFATIREAKDAVLEWLRWYNRNRMHSTLDYSSPIEYEQRWSEEQRKTAA